MNDTNANALAAELNGHISASTDPVESLRREIVILRARCSNLRNWCRPMLDEPTSKGLIDAALETGIRTVSPEIDEMEANELIGRLARGGDVPLAHPLTPTTADPNRLRAIIATLKPEHERLRQAFFALYDRLYPEDVLTDEYFLAQEWHEVSISDLIAEFEREAEAKS